jgi:hypothetical protein
MKHEQFIEAIAHIAIAQLEGDDDATQQVRNIKLVYGAGPNGVRGVTYYDKWQGVTGSMPFVEISAFNQESVVQVAGTVIHELGHVLAGWNAGHGKDWHAACDRMGLRQIKAAGTQYVWANFKPAVRHAITALGRPTEGQVKSMGGALGGNVTFTRPRGCQAGIGTRGGKSRGQGSGSRLRLFECECCPPIKLRVARDCLNIHCNDCSSDFSRK